MTTAEIEARVEELRSQLAALEAVNAPCNEREIQNLRGRIRELEALLAGSPDWRRRIRERGVKSAVEDFTKRRRR